MSRAKITAQHVMDAYDHALCNWKSQLPRPWKLLVRDMFEALRSLIGEQEDPSDAEGSCECRDVKSKVVWKCNDCGKLIEHPHR